MRPDSDLQEQHLRSSRVSCDLDPRCPSNLLIFSGSSLPPESLLLRESLLLPESLSLPKHLLPVSLPRSELVLAMKRPPSLLPKTPSGPIRSALQERPPQQHPSQKSRLAHRTPARLPPPPLVQSRLGPARPPMEQPLNPIAARSVWMCRPIHCWSCLNSHPSTNGKRLDQSAQQDPVHPRRHDMWLTGTSA